MAVSQFYNVYAPILQSPQDLDVRVDAVVQLINSTSTHWRVWSYAVRSGAQIGVIPGTASFAPSWQIVKFVLYRPDGSLGSRAAATAVVQAAAIRSNLSLRSLIDWGYEVKEQAEEAIKDVPSVIPAWIKWTVGIGVGVFALDRLYGIARVFSR